MAASPRDAGAGKRSAQGAATIGMKVARGEGEPRIGSHDPTSSP
jgi:hypothetical protein